MGKWWMALMGRLGRRYWLRRIDLALLGAYRERKIDSELLHELDHRLKYE
jgi:hypothetical protein